MAEEKHAMLRRLRSVSGVHPGGSAAPAGTGIDDTDHDERRKGVSRSIETIERALGNITGLQDHVHFYKDLSGELRRSLEEERQQRTEAQRRSRDLQELLASERERALLAERRNVAAAELINELRAQLEAVQAETKRLMTAVASLGDVRFDPETDAGSGRSRLAA